MCKHGLAASACHTDNQHGCPGFCKAFVQFLVCLKLELGPIELFTYLISRNKKYKTCVSMVWQSCKGVCLSYRQAEFDPK